MDYEYCWIEYRRPWLKVSPRRFSLIVDIHLYLSTHNQFLLKFKFIKFSIKFVAMVAKKEDGCGEFNTYFQQRYLKTIIYLYLKPFKCNVKPVQHTQMNDYANIYIFVAALNLSSRKWLK